MFAIDCPVHATRVLVPATRIRQMYGTKVGILLDIECWCGEHVAVRTGRRRHGHAPAREPAQVG